MSTKERITTYICCPICKNDVRITSAYLECKACKRKYLVKDNIVHMLPDVSKDLALSIEKWDDIYKNSLKTKTYKKEYTEYMHLYHNDIYRQVTEVKIKERGVYLEIGCGMFFLGQELAPVYDMVIGIDCCPTALLIAKKMLDEKKIKNYLLIQGDILQMPIKDKKIDMLYGGGVIEHFEDTQSSVNELGRVLQKGGVSFNTVSYLNIGSLTYRQLWGNIPNAPILKQIAEFVHIKLLRAKHMKFGYELSFLSSTLKTMHKNAGFKKVIIKRFEVPLLFEFIPSFARKPFIWLATNSSLFWPMVKIVATK